MKLTACHHHAIAYDGRGRRLRLQVRRGRAGVGGVVHELRGVGRRGAQELARVGVAAGRKALEPGLLADEVVERGRR